MKVWIVKDRASGQPVRGYAGDPRIIGFDGFEFDPERQSLEPYVPQQASVPTHIVRDIEGRLRTFAMNTLCQEDAQKLLRILELLDRAVLEHSK